MKLVKPILFRVCDCGALITSKSESIGDQVLDVSDTETITLAMFNCPNCHTTISVRKTVPDEAQAA